MIFTDPEKDYWPWQWHHNGNPCNTMQDYKKAWQSIDWVHDKAFDPAASKTQNRSGEPMRRKVANGIECVTEPVTVDEKISLADYKDYAIKKFDSQMAKIANMGKLSLGLSAGIDSTMCLAWLVKNKADFDVFSWKSDPWKGDLNTFVVGRALEMTKLLGVKHTLIDYNQSKPDQHDLMRNYCESDGYMFPQSQLMSEGDAWSEVYDDLIGQRIRLEPFGIDDQFLHEPSSWNRFVPKRLRDYLEAYDNPPFQLYWQNYMVGGKESYWKKHHDPRDGYQQMSGWHDVLVDYMSKKQMISPATSKEWYEMWHKIDESSCDETQFMDMISVGWLKNQLVQWTGKQEIAELTKSTPCTEIYYSPNAENKKYLIDACQKIAQLYLANKREDEPSFLTASWWRGMIDMINTFNKISPRAVESIHTINWFLKNQ